MAVNFTVLMVTKQRAKTRILYIFFTVQGMTWLAIFNNSGLRKLRFSPAHCGNYVTAAARSYLWLDIKVCSLQ